MPLPIEDYALIGDMHAAALVGRDGSIDWLCLPRFDSGACFAALLGDERHGRWRIGPVDRVERVERRYRDGTLVLETDFFCDSGTVRVVDCMPPRDRVPDVVRVVEGIAGRVEMELDLALRFDYGRVVPWVKSYDHGIRAIAGPDAIELTADIPVHGENMRTGARFTVEAGERVGFVLRWHPSHEDPPPALNAFEAVTSTTTWWEEWSAATEASGPWADLVRRSLITLKALTYAPTGGIVAAPTTSLPEGIGGSRNWDYRFCWLRDAALTLGVLAEAGHVEEAAAWRDWLLRAAAGRPADTQIMYGAAGERRLTELELDWLPGYEGSRPVRIGNAASEQVQLDVFGEIMDALLEARVAGLAPQDDAWALQRALLDHVEETWTDPDHGIWEMRGAPRQFVHSKVMAWCAFDRGVRTAEEEGLSGPVDRWRALRDEIHAEVCERGYDAERQTFTQSYGSQALDAATLLIPAVGFLPPDDPRVVGTVEAVQRELTAGDLVLRYRAGEANDGLEGDECAFLPCSFWLVSALVLIGRRDEATELFDRLVGLTNDVGLLSEQYDARAGRLVGNFPQAFTHVGLVAAAQLLDRPADALVSSRRLRSRA